VLETDGPAATEAAGARAAAELVAGDVVHVTGELGSGKTTFVRGACRALGVTVAVTSPTFGLAHRYPARAGLAVSHLDLYRLGGLALEDPQLLDDYLGPDRIAFVEWPDTDAAAELGAPRLTVAITHLGGDRRRIELRP
jgi:tRNA threonylcarbamoyladenosine biosynthesis protein TsaE